MPSESHAPVYREWKVVQRPGAYAYPVMQDGKVVNRLVLFTPDKIKRYAKTTQSMLDDGISIPIIPEHDNKGVPLTRKDLEKKILTESVGFVRGVRVKPSGELELLHEVTDPVWVPKMGTTVMDCSPGFRDWYRTGDGKKWTDVVAHVALTHHPVDHHKPKFTRAGNAASTGTVGGEGGYATYMSLTPAGPNAPHLVPIWEVPFSHALACLKPAGTSFIFRHADGKQRFGTRTAGVNWLRAQYSKQFSLSPDDEGAIWMAVMRAPIGGISIQGKFFRGGQFIPNEVIEAATPQEKAKIQAAKEAHVAKRGTDAKSHMRDAETVHDAILRHAGVHAKIDQHPLDKRDTLRRWSALKAEHGDKGALERVVTLAATEAKKLQDMGEGAESTAMGKYYQRRLSAYAHMVGFSVNPDSVGEYKQGLKEALAGEGGRRSIQEAGSDPSKDKPDTEKAATVPETVSQKVKQKRDETAEETPKSAKDVKHSTEKSETQSYPSPHEAIEASPHLSAVKKKAFSDAVKLVESKLSAKAKERLGKNLKGFVFHGDIEDLTAALVERSPDLKNELKGKNAGGAYSKKSGEMFLDGGGRIDGKKVGTDAVYAHEYAHAIDGPELELSKDQGWREAWRAEAQKVSNYATKTPQEGFAEFGRLVFSSGLGTDQLRERYPLSMAHWEKLGLLPDGVQAAEAGKQLAEGNTPQMADVFEAPFHTDDAIGDRPLPRRGHGEDLKGYLTGIGGAGAHDTIRDYAKQLHGVAKQAADEHNSAVSMAMEKLSAHHGKAFTRSHQAFKNDDYNAVNWFDVVASEVANAHPGLFQSTYDADYDHDTDTDNKEKLWDMLKEGKRGNPDIREFEDQAVQEWHDNGRPMPEGYEPEQVGEADTSFDFGANVESADKPAEPEEKHPFTPTPEETKAAWDKFAAKAAQPGSGLTLPQPGTKTKSSDITTNTEQSGMADDDKFAAKAARAGSGLAIPKATGQPAQEQPKPAGNWDEIYNPDKVPVVSNDEAVSGNWDQWHAGLGDEAKMRRMAAGMKGIEGREYGIREHSPGQFQMVSRKAGEMNKSQPEVNKDAPEVNKNGQEVNKAQPAPAPEPMQVALGDAAEPEEAADTSFDFGEEEKQNYVSMTKKQIENLPANERVKARAERAKARAERETKKVEQSKKLKEKYKVADIHKELADYAGSLGLGHDGNNKYSSSGGSRYLNVGVKGDDGNWNNEHTIRISDHGNKEPNFGNGKLVTTSQEDGEEGIKRSIEEAKKAIRKIAAEKRMKSESIPAPMQVATGEAPAADEFMQQKPAGRYSADDIEELAGQSFTNDKGLTVDLTKDEDGTWSIGSKYGLSAQGAANLLNEMQADKAKGLFSDDVTAQKKPEKRLMPGDKVKYTGRGADPDTEAELRGYHEVNGKKMARVIFRPKDGMPFENSVPADDVKPMAEKLEWAAPSKSKDTGGELPGMKDTFAPGMFGAAATNGGGDISHDKMEEVYTTSFPGRPTIPSHPSNAEIAKELGIEYGSHGYKKAIQENRHKSQLLRDYQSKIKNHDNLIKEWEQSDDGKKFIEHQKIRQSPEYQKFVEDKQKQLEEKEEKERQARMEQAVKDRPKAFRILRGMGFIREHTSGNSAYYRHPRTGITVRISDHHVPLTSLRQESLNNGGRTWANSSNNFVLGDDKDLDEWINDIKQKIQIKEQEVFRGGGKSKPVPPPMEVATGEKQDQQVKEPAPAAEWKEGHAESASDALARVQASPNQPKDRDWERYASTFGMEDGKFHHVEIPTDQLAQNLESGHLRRSNSVNPKTVDEKVQSGDRNPIVITHEPGKGSLVVDGNHSLQAAIKGGDKTVKAIVSEKSPFAPKQEESKGVEPSKATGADKAAVDANDYIAKPHALTPGKTSYFAKDRDGDIVRRAFETPEEAAKETKRQREMPVSTSQPAVEPKPQPSGPYGLTHAMGALDAMRKSGWHADQAASISEAMTRQMAQVVAPRRKLDIAMRMIHGEPPAVQQALLDHLEKESPEAYQYGQFNPESIGLSVRDVFKNHADKQGKMVGEEPQPAATAPEPVPSPLAVATGGTESEPPASPSETPVVPSKTPASLPGMADAAGPEKLKLKNIVRTEKNVRSMKDRRAMVTRTVAEFTDSEGNVYRKSFEAKGKDPVIPESGTHEELNKKHQFQFGGEKQGTIPFAPWEKKPAEIAPDVNLSVGDQEDVATGELFKASEAVESGAKHASATPRDVASAVTRALDPSYAFARSSSVGNAGEDLIMSKRHLANAWRGLEQAEADGIAEKLVNRDRLAENEPHKLMTHADENPLTALAMHFALKHFPAEPGYKKTRYGRALGQTDAETAKTNREHYVQAYRSIKAEAERLAQSESDPRKALSGLADHVGKVIRALRGQVSHDSIKTTTGVGLYNETANALTVMPKKLRDGVSWGAEQSTSPMGKMMEFTKLASDTHGKVPTEGTLEERQAYYRKLARHAKNVIEGQSLPRAFGVSVTGEKKDSKPKITPADMYVEVAERTGGRDTPEGQSFLKKHLLETVGLRGIQFGNYVSDDERIHHLKKAAEAFVDLADVTGLPDNAASLKGAIGLAFGARGNAGALAHYEPDTKVINLTRKSGVGSLAHEWGHALDHFLAGGGKTETKQTALHGMLSDDRYSNKKDDPVWAGMDAVRQAWKDSGYQARLSTALKRHVDKGLMSDKKADQYWDSRSEKFARTFEQWVQHELLARGQKNTYLAGFNHKEYDGPAPEGHELWPTREEITKMAPAFRALLHAVREKHFSQHDMSLAAASRAQRVRRMMRMLSPMEVAMMT